jgi:hypothetical protein
MAEAPVFVPKAERAADGNRKEFVRFCREDLTTFGAALDFDAARWDASDHYRRRGSPGRTILNFTQITTVRSWHVGPPLPEPLGAFAKAYIRYGASQQRRLAVPSREIQAFRLLALALGEKGLRSDIGLVDAHVLDHAVKLATERFGKMTAGLAGAKLAKIAEFLRTKRLSDRIPIRWKHGLKGWRRSPTRIGKEADERREAKLPSKEALDAIPLAYELASEPRDVIVTSVMALLFCAPDRINEIFALPERCEVEEMLDGKRAFGLRWAGSKGFSDHIKLILGVMVDVAKDAIKRLRKHTAEPRRIAAWYEANPCSLYLPDDCAHLRGHDLTLDDVRQITGLSHNTSVSAMLKRAGVKHAGIVQRSGSPFATHIFRFLDVERAVVALLPPGFPILDPRTGLKYSQAIMVARLGEFATDRQAPWRSMISPVSYQHIRYGFGRAGNGARNVFERLGLSTRERPLFLTSYQIRHHLNTIANKSNVSMVDIAAWSGRLDIGQNSAYDHETAEEILERRRRMERQLADVRASRGEGSSPTKIRPNPPVSREEIAKRSSHGHATEIGFCEQDFASSPCVMFMECLHCTKHTCIKGYDPKQVDKVADSLKLARQSLGKAQEAESMQYEGAKDWVRVQTETVQRLEQLHAILTDPSIPDGTKIRLTRSGQYTLIEQAMHDHEEAVSIQLLPPSNRRPLPSPSDVGDA